MQRGLLYVISPVAIEHLQSVDLLLQGLIEIPRSVLQVTLFAWRYFIKISGHF